MKNEDLKVKTWAYWAFEACRRPIWKRRNEPSREQWIQFCEAL